jgi:hypothetical protein
VNDPCRRLWHGAGIGTAKASPELDFTSVPNIARLLVFDRASARSTRVNSYVEAVPSSIASAEGESYPGVQGFLVKPAALRVGTTRAELPGSRLVRSN